MKTFGLFNRFFLLTISFVFICSSCYKDIIDDLKKDIAVKYDGTWAANIVNTEANLTDFNLETGEDADFKIENQDNILVLTYNTTKLYSLRGEHLFSASLATTSFNFTLPAPSSPIKSRKANYNYTISKDIELNLDGMIIDSILLKSGVFTLNFTSDLNHEYVITLKSDYILNENMQKLDMTKRSTTPNVSFSINAKDKYVILPLGRNAIPITIEIEVIPGEGALNFPYHFNVTNTFPNMGFSWMHGQFIKKTEYLSKNLEMEFLRNNAILKCKAYPAKVHLDVRNNVGLPLSLDIDSVIICNPVENMYIPLITFNELLTAKYPIVRGEYATTTRTFDIDSFLFDNRNSFILFRATGILNNDGMDGNKYYITDTSRYRVHARIEFPLKINLHELSYFDTVAFSMDSLNVEELEYVIFRIQLENNFAFGIQSQVYFTNDNYAIIDSLFDAPLFIPKASVDPANDYHLIETSFGSEKVTVTNERLQKLAAAASNIIIRADAKINKSDPYMIFYYNEQKLGIKLGMQAHVKTQFDTSKNK